MPLRSGISKKLRQLSIYAGLIGLIVAVLAFAYGYKQLQQYGETYPVEWAGEAGSMSLRFDKTNPYFGRIIFVGHSEFGQRMVDEYIQSFQAINPGITLQQHRFYTVISSDPDALGTHPYLNYFALAKLKSAAFRRQLFPSVGTAQPPTLAAPETYLQSLFTRGLYNSPDNALVDQLRFLVQNARPGSHIRISIFLLFYSNENEPLLLDLLAAAEHGVNVQLITDLPEATNPETRGIGHAFQENFAKRLHAAAIKGQSDSWIKSHASVDWDSKNHTKIFLFSDTAGFKKWVLISSENLTDAERQKFQAGLLMRDAGSYDAFDKYWHQILEGSYTNLWSASNGKNLSHYFFPQTTGEDEIYRQLDQIQASLTPDKTGRLSISMARWNFERFPVAMKLVDLAERGIKIEIVTRNNPQIVDDIILRVLSHRTNITLHTADVDRLNIHSKYILYEGYYQGHDTKILWIGSHNFTGMAMRNNYETWTEVRDDKIFREFSDNFTELKSMVPVDPGSGSIK